MSDEKTLRNFLFGKEVSVLEFLAGLWGMSHAITHPSDWATGLCAYLAAYFATWKVRQTPDQETQRPD